MRQQINLYQESLIDRKPPLHGGLCAAIVGACVVLILASAFYLSWLEGQRKEQLVALEQSRTQLEADLQALKLQFPPRQKNPEVERELNRLQAELAGRQTLLTYFDQLAPGRTDGFSPVVEGLARYPYPGVWLTGIWLDRDEQRVRLAGSATRAELVPAFLKHLGVKKVLAGQTFARLTLSRLKETANRVDFRLESEYGEAN